MLRSPNGRWDVSGSFVFESLCPMAIRRKDSVGEKEKTDKCIEAGELVSVDLIQTSRYPESNNGPFLRLTDGSGYLFEFKHGERVMKQIPVESGLWEFYSDNDPSGVLLHRQPSERRDMRVSPEKRFLPMQKIFCDKRVISRNGINFYRVQGTSGWVYEKGSDDLYRMIPTSKVQRGLFAYRSLNYIAVRDQTSVGEDCTTSRYVLKDEIILADVVRESPYGAKHGPFVRLCDGSGWLFERKDNKPALERVLIQNGRWSFEVVNPRGIALEQQPMERKYGTGLGIVCEHAVRIWCDRQIQSPTSGVSYYRVENTEGWVCDKLEGRPTIKPIMGLTSQAEHVVGSLPSPWTPEIVREIASHVDGLEEIAFVRENKLMIYQTQLGVRIIVFYPTCTVGVVVGRGETEILQTNCSQFKLLEILKNPPSPHDQEIRGGYRGRYDVDNEEKKSYDHSSVSSISILDDLQQLQEPQPARAEEEQRLRFSLLTIDKQMEDLRRKRLELLKLVDAFDVERSIEALKSEEKRIINEDDEEEEVEVGRREEIVNSIRREKELHEQLELELKEGRKQRAALKKYSNKLDRHDGQYDDDEDGIEDDIDLDLFQIEEDNPKHRCNICGDRFTSWHALSQHQYTNRH